MGIFFGSYKLTLMTRCILFLSFFIALICKTLAYDFTLATHQSKLLSWINSNGIEEKLLLSQVQISQKNILVKKGQLPFQYIIDQSCKLTESLDQAIIYQPKTSQHITLSYIHMEGSEIVNNNLLEFVSTTSMKVSKQLELSISSQELSGAKKVSQISVGNNKKDLYMYHNQTLISFDAKMYSFQPMCYMLSQMTNELCQNQHCFALSPAQIFYMEVGNTIKNYSFVNNQFILPSFLEKNQIFLNLQFINQQSLQSLKQQVVTISGNSLIKVDFQLSQNTITSSNKNSLRTESFSLAQQFDVKIKLRNTFPVYAIKMIKLYKGEQLIESDKILFKPFQQISYQTLWRNDQAQIPKVEVYSQTLVLEGTFSMNNYVDLQYDQQLLFGNKYHDIIQHDSMEEVTTSESKSQGFPLIIVFALVGGSLLASSFGICLCRRKIFKKCYDKQKQQAQPQQKVKKQVECDDNFGSSNEFRNDYEINFEKKYSLFSINPSTITTSTLDKTEKNNPEEEENSIQEELNEIKNEIEQKLSQTEKKDQQNKKDHHSAAEQTFGPRFSTPPRRNLFCQDSLGSSYSKSYTKRKLFENDTNADVKEKQQEQNI